MILSFDPESSLLRLYHLLTQTFTKDTSQGSQTSGPVRIRRKRKKLDKCNVTGRAGLWHE